MHKNTNKDWHTLTKQKKKEELFVGYWQKIVTSPQILKLS